jgi:transposase
MAVPHSDGVNRVRTTIQQDFANPKSSGRIGLTPSKYQSGEVDWTGRISKVGGAMALFEAANVMLSRVTRFSTLKAWALRVAKLRRMKRAKVALACKLAVVLRRMWVDRTDFPWRKMPAAAAA